MEQMIGIGNLDDKKVTDIKLEICCGIHNTSRISIAPEAIDFINNSTECVSLKYDSDDKINIETDVKKQLCNMSQSEIDDVKIKQQVDSDSDVEVDLAYRVIDTFNKYEVKTFKQDDEEISTDCETSLKI